MSKNYAKNSFEFSVISCQLRLIPLSKYFLSFQLSVISCQLRLMILSRY